MYSQNDDYGRQETSVLEPTKVFVYPFKGSTSKLLGRATVCFDNGIGISGWAVFKDDKKHYGVAIGVPTMKDRNTGKWEKVVEINFNTKEGKAFMNLIEEAVGRAWSDQEISSVAARKRETDGIPF